MLTMVNCTVIVDGSGDPVALQPDQQGLLISSVEHIAAGQYKIHLSQPFNASICGAVSTISGPADVSAGVVCESSQDVDISDQTDPYIVVNCFAGGVLTDPTPFSGFALLMFVRNSSVRF